jgi:hypothetical protein
MEVITQNPVLINKGEVFNGYTVNSEDNESLYGREQKVDVGSIIVKGVNPVFSDNREISQNEFLYSEPVMYDGETLTPMDEYLNFTSSDLLTNPYSKPKTTALNTPLPTPTISITPSQYSANVQNIPGGPTAKEQVDKAKNEGKFWNSIKGGWDKFKTSENGKIILQSGASYVLDKLGATAPTAPTTSFEQTPPTDTKAPMSKTTKTILIVGGVALVGVIIYMIAKKK